MFYRAKRVCECDLLPGAIIISTHPPTLDHKYVFGRSLSTHKPVKARIAPCENKLSCAVPSSPYHQKRQLLTTQLNSLLIWLAL